MACFALVIVVSPLLILVFGSPCKLSTVIFEKMRCPSTIVADLKTRKFEYVPHIRPFHEKTLAEAQALLVRAQKTLATLEA